VKGHDAVLRFATRVLVLVLALGAAGCGVAEKQAGTIRVVYPVFSDVPVMDSYMRDVKRQFEDQNAGVTVHLVPVNASPDDYATKVRLMDRSRAAAPDVFVGDSYNIAADAAATYLLPLDDYLADWPDWINEFFESAKNAGRAADGKTYGVPIGTDARGLWYNKNVFARAGLPVDWRPKTWSDVLRAAEQIKRCLPDVQPMYMPLGKPSGEKVSMETLEMLLYGSSTRELYNPATKKWVTPSPGMADALAFIDTAVRKRLTQTPAQAEDPQWRTEVVNLVARDKIGIMLEGGWYASDWNRDGTSHWPDWSKTMGTVAFPTQYGQAPGRVSLSGGFTLAVGSNNIDPAASFKFLMVALNERNSATIDRGWFSLPVRKDVQAHAHLDSVDPTEPFWSSLVPITRYRPAVPEYPQVSNAMQVACDAVVNGDDPNQAAQQLNIDIQKIVGTANTEPG
jgi:multiple sugar transport system substrate-binding protein